MDEDLVSGRTKRDRHVSSKMVQFLQNVTKRAGGVSHFINEESVHEVKPSIVEEERRDPKPKVMRRKKFAPRKGRGRRPKFSTPPTVPANYETNNQENCVKSEIQVNNNGDERAAKKRKLNAVLAISTPVASVSADDGNFERERKKRKIDPDLHSANGTQNGHTPSQPLAPLGDSIVFVGPPKVKELTLKKKMLIAKIKELKAEEAAAIEAAARRVEREKERERMESSLREKERERLEYLAMRPGSSSDQENAVVSKHFEPDHYCLGQIFPQTLICVNSIGNSFLPQDCSNKFVICNQSGGEWVYEQVRVQECNLQN